jgi:hypothetical protein
MPAQREAAVKHRYLTPSLILIFCATPVSAFEAKNPEPGERRLSVELEIVPIPPQQDFEQYVQEQAAAGRRDAKPEERPPKQDPDKERQANALNPMVLFRW